MTSKQLKTIARENYIGRKEHESAHVVRGRYSATHIVTTWVPMSPCHWLMQLTRAARLVLHVLGGLCHFQLAIRRRKEIAIEHKTFSATLIQKAWKASCYSAALQEGVRQLLKRAHAQALLDADAHRNEMAAKIQNAWRARCDGVALLRAVLVLDTTAVLTLHRLCIRWWPQQWLPRTHGAARVVAVGHQDRPVGRQHILHEPALRRHSNPPTSYFAVSPRWQRDPRH